MKTPKKITSVLFCFIVICLMTLSASKDAKAFVTIELLGQTVNGDTIPYDIGCGGLVSFSVEDVYRVYIRAYSSDPTRPVTLNYIISPSTPGVHFYDPLPQTCLPGSFVQTLMVFDYTDLYYGFVRFIANDGVDYSYCDLSIDWAEPVEISSFISNISKNDVALNWTTSSETNNARFEIERTAVTNGQQTGWNKIGTVNGFGNSTVPKSYSFNDRGLNSGTYSYRLKQVDLNGHFAYHNLNNEVNIGTPEKFELSQNYPNPFNPSTQIDFEIPKDGNVNISIYDNSGKLVSTLTDGFKAAGYYSVIFNASNLSSGVYFYRLESQNISQVKKMTLIK
jgi:hypothetical protein